MEVMNGIRIKIDGKLLAHELSTLYHKDYIQVKVLDGIGNPLHSKVQDYFNQDELILNACYSISLLDKDLGRFFLKSKVVKTSETNTIKYRFCPLT